MMTLTELQNTAGWQLAEIMHLIFSPFLVCVSLCKPQAREYISKAYIKLTVNFFTPKSKTTNKINQRTAFTSGLSVFLILTLN